MSYTPIQPTHRPASAPALPLRVDACIADHIGDRAEQQDRVTLLTNPARPGKILAVLADGMGGRSGGKMASEQVVATARGLFQEAPTPGQSPRQLLSQIAEEAHAVIKLGAISSQLEPHSTLVALMLDKERVDWVHAGDSRLYWFRDQHLQHCTRDHAYDPNAAQHKSTAASSLKHKNVLYSAMGIRLPLQLDHGDNPQPVRGDAFLLASDGLWAHFAPTELCTIVQKNSAREAAECLVKEARIRAAGQGDNLSLAIIKLV